MATEMFYVIERNDGYVFIQRYIPSNYADVTFKEKSKHGDVRDAVAAVEALRGDA
jgi:hypothetical protein